MELKDKLKSLRIENQLTQCDIGKYISRTDKAVSRWEKGTSKPSYTVLVALSKFFAVPLPYLISEEESFKQTKAQQLINELIKNGTIKDVESITKEVGDMILNAVKIDLQMQLNKKKEDKV